MFRLAASLGLSWREARAERRRRGLSTRLLASAGAVPLPDEGAEDSELVKALGMALREGALESAGVLTERLASRFSRPSGPLAARTVPLLVNGLLLLGEQTRARAFGKAHVATLLSTADGAALLGLLGLEEAPLWLPDGRPHLAALNRRITDDNLGVEELTSLLRPKAWHWFQDPELHLLYFNALRRHDLERACGFANRLQSLHGLPHCRPRAGEPPAELGLFALEFEDAPQVTGGPLVSIVMAVRNAAGSVCFAVDSLLGQSYPRLEILIGDDASDDDTVEILKRRYAAEPRVQLFGSRVNQGAYNFRNALFARAQGEFLTCHDADDLALPTRIAAQVAQLQRSGAVACLTNWLRFDAQRGVVFFKDQSASRLCLVSLMLRRSAHEALGPLRSARFGADLERYADLRARFGEAAICRIRAPLIWGAWSSASTTRQAGSEALEDGYRSLARRSYSELVLAKHLPGSTLTDAAIETRLQALDNYLEPNDIQRLT